MPRWLLWCVLALLSFGAWAVVFKGLSHISGLEGQALSAIGLLPFMALGISRKCRQGSSRWKGAALAIIAGLLVAAGNVAYYEALRQGAMAMTVAPLTALYPLVTVALAMVFLREKPHPVQAVGIALALAAIYVLNLEPGAGRPDFRSSGTSAIPPILLWGVGALLQKVSTNHASSELSTFAFLAAMVGAGAAIVLYGGGTVAGHSAGDWSLLFLLGFLFGLGNLALIAAYGSGGKASIVTPLSGLYPVVTIPLAMQLFGEKAGPVQVAGIALALAGVVALSYERQKETERVGQAS